jgi:hypothetical protein
MHSTWRFRAILAVGLAFVPAALPCQTNAVALSATLSDFHLRDDYLSPVAFHGALPGATISYYRSTVRSRQAIELHFATGSINSSAQRRDIRQYLGSLSFSYGRRIRSSEGRRVPLALFLGGGISSFASKTDLEATDQTSQYTFYDQSWYWSHALDLQVLAEYRMAHRRQLTARLTSPLLRLVSRPENAHYFNSENAEVIDDFLSAATSGSLTTFWESPVLALQLDYRHPVGSSADLEIGYRFRYTAADRPLELRMYSNTFRAGIVWRP